MDEAKEVGRSIKRSFSMKLIFVAFMLLFSGEAAFAYEQPKYEIVKIYKGFELRRYAPYIVAETVVSGKFDDAGNKAFRILFKYISGDNLKKTEIPMTAPVEQTPDGENSDSYVFSFIMPSKYTLDTLPIPADPRIKLRQVKSRLLAARTYSGTWSEKRYRENETALLEAVKAAGFTAVGEPIFARYNSPFSLWFLRKNEVLLEVEEERDIQQ
jgi:hypothetical protein